MLTAYNSFFQTWDKEMPKINPWRTHWDWYYEDQQWVKTISDTTMALDKECADMKYYRTAYAIRKYISKHWYEYYIEKKVY